MILTFITCLVIIVILTPYSFTDGNTMTVAKRNNPAVIVQTHNNITIRMEWLLFRRGKDFCSNTRRTNYSTESQDQNSTTQDEHLDVLSPGPKTHV